MKSAASRSAAVRHHVEAGEAVVAGLAQVALGGRALRLGAAGDEEHGDAQLRAPPRTAPRSAASGALRPSWSQAAQPHGPSGSVARAGGEAAEIVGQDHLPVRQRGLVDVEHQGRALDLRRAARRSQALASAATAARSRS